MRAAITGLGMISSVGNGAAASCAAIRAGISRPGPLPITVLDRDGLDAIQVTGHPVPLARGFEGLAVHALLAGHALGDLARTVGLASLGQDAWERTALLVCVSRERAEEPSGWDEQLAWALPRMIPEASGLPLDPARISVSHAGHAGVLIAVRQAMAALDARQVDRAIVLGVDSLVGEEDAAWFAAEGRLKLPDQPVGLMPGQAAGAVLLEPERAGRRPGAPALATIADVAVAPVRPFRADDLDSDGAAVARAILAARGGLPGPFALYADQNGETWRAREWGMALTRLAGANAAEDLLVSLPAFELGDTGAASGAIAIALAVRSFVRRYARAPRALVCSRSERDHVAAARIEPAARR